jgi:molybdopterin-containing oxidoreductase family iron-sulfur binding subunit
MKRETEPLDLAAIRAQLNTSEGQQYWRCLDELIDNQRFQEYLRREFPQFSGLDGLNRRGFLKLVGASLALAGLGACARRPAEKIVPYVEAPEQIVPGKPLFYATAMTLHGVATGLLVESHTGRPTKVEGNPSHPSSLGATNIFAQASVLAVYDPDRSQTVTYRRAIRPWNSFISALRALLDRKSTGQGIRILTETVNSPTLARQIRAVLSSFPGARWHQYDPTGSHNSRAGSLLAFGEYLTTNYRFDQAAVILALDADIFGSDNRSLRHIHDFAARRRPQGTKAATSRLYVVEGSPSITGAIADHRLPLAPGQIALLARMFARSIGVSVPEVEDPAPFGKHAAWIEALARDLKQHGGSAIVVAGERQPPMVHALAHAMNHALGNAGRTVIQTEPVEAAPVNQIESLTELVRDMEAGAVDILLMLGGNPVYTAPADLNFAKSLGNVVMSIHLSLYQDETSYLSHWHIPEAHFLESWSDARAHDGTVSIVQPLIAPLYGGKTAHEVLAAFSEGPSRSGYEIVRDYWKARMRSTDFEAAWEKALHDGFIEGTAYKEKRVTIKREALLKALSAGGRKTVQERTGFEIVFAPDPTIADGRFANNGWLQELPKPLTKVTWDNAALISPATASRLGLRYDVKPIGGALAVDLIDINYGGRAVRAPVWVMPGHPDDTVTIHLGYGRTRAGRVGSGLGFNAFSIRTSQALWIGTGAEIRNTGQTHLIASTQIHHAMQGRDLVRVGTIEQYRDDPEFARRDHPESNESLYPPYPYKGYAWGMAIDLNACVGCNACVVACQAENNIPVVGKDQVLRSREMHWLRIDTYHKGSPDNPETYFQPVLCMHCENAPCEVVCPVTATAHSAEGLNDMVYNRCVGTRYCSNNCPYKVRRFNFLQYADWETPSLKPMRNPDVTVRSRGVMEKCTYCVQRINHARIEAEKDGRRIRDGEIVTACQAACPAEAIVFGDINDPNSRVSQMKAEPRNYGLLAELNTRPRTTYLARLRNPNPDIEKPGKE